MKYLYEYSKRLRELVREYSPDGPGTIPATAVLDLAEEMEDLAEKIEMAEIIEYQRHLAENT